MVKEEHSFLENEFEHQPVPEQRRKSLLSVSLVWIGFPMVITGALVGGSIVSALGFRTGILAMLLGNLILFAYVGMQSSIAAKTGMSFALVATRVFGPKGYRVTSGLLSTIVIGWFAVQTGLTGASLHSSLGTSVFWIDILAGILFMGITIIGVRALSVIGALSVPFFLILGLYAVNIALTHTTWSQIFQFAGHPANGISFGLAVTMVIALFIDSGTMTPDFTRWAKSPRDAVIATFTAFPFANFMSMFFGAVVTAAGASSNGDFSAIIARLGPVGGLIAAAFLFVNSGSVCSHCLYNAAVGWSQILGKKLRWMAFVLGIVGISAAAAGMWNLLATWLSFLGVIVPGIGGTIIGHFTMFKNSDVTVPKIAFASWGAGAASSLLAHIVAPGLSDAVIGMVVAFGVYVLVAPQFAASRAIAPRMTIEEDLS
ncbi:cytosine permease [Sulfobacillus thermosulfidooxidans DSM 9293]|uniref:Cytosine permease n=3 Tax=Sulfobacillus thermosulfidooxidans TaxID=28034 RepID=A0A1W1WHV4_SULTA|nr:cytosine permease [Sulfobacillus thermosulfidooxidans]SMC05729.1 cytosine permease [Sulfobacillus thermosulfidooxidans DSM 9293]